MAGKLRHFLERDGRYYARLVIPKELRPYLDGKTELRSPLGGDYRTAVRRHAGEVAVLQQKIADAEALREHRTGMSRPGARFPMSAEEMAATHYRHRLAFDEEIRRTTPAYATGDVDDGLVADLRAAIGGSANDADLDRLVGAAVRRFRHLGNTSAEPGTTEWRQLSSVIAAAELEALARKLERDEGDFKGQPEHPALKDAHIEPEPQRPPLPFKSIFNAYFDELIASTGRGKAARERWEPVFYALREFVRHDDVHRLTRADVLAFKDEKLKTLSARTVRDTYIASLRAVFNWAKDNDRMDSNPAAGIKVRYSAKPRTREKGFTDNEAVAILKKCRAYQPKLTANPRTSEAAETTAAKRWAPWLCAFSGARIAEITQLRKQDVRREGDTVVMRITPEAGSVKTDQYRDVPVHQQLIDLGFMDLVDGASNGPLFYPPNKKSGRYPPARTVADRVGKWLRDSDLVPEAVSPNHGWRHRFKTLGYEHGIDARVVDAIQGHAGRTAGEDYGDVTIKARKAAIDRLPHYKI